MRRARTASDLYAEPIPVQTKLAAAWASFVFLYVYVDILGLYMPGIIDDILEGFVWKLEITQAWAFGALTLMAIPILMVVLSTMLPARANRVTNLTVATIYVLVSAANAVGESWTYFFALAVALEFSVLALIFHAAWTWPKSLRPYSPSGPARPASSPGTAVRARGA